jgi:hypothetical protein
VPRRVLQALMAIGVAGFVGAFSIPYAGTWLDHFELPAFFETNTIALPDGGRLAATMPLQRVQRYGKDGRFRNGWFVKAHGGHFGIGLTSDGRAVVCTGRGRQILVFELDGQSVGDPRPCFRVPREVPKILQPTDFPHGDLNLQRAIPVDPPSPSLVSILLVPLWHPFVAWFMALVGYVALRFGRADRQTGSSPSAAGSAA